MSFPCNCCPEPGDNWSHASIAIMGRAASGVATAANIAAVVTSPPHEYTGFRRAWTYTEYWSLMEGGDSADSATKGSVNYYTGAAIIPGHLDPEAFLVVEPWDDLTPPGEGQTWVLDSSSLSEVGEEVTADDIEDYVRGRMALAGWMAVDDLPHVVFPGSGLYVGGRYGEARQLRWQGSWHFEQYPYGGAPFPNGHVIRGVRYIESDGEEESELAVNVNYVASRGGWFEGGSDIPSEGTWHELPCNRDESWDVGISPYFISSFNFLNAYETGI